MRDYREPDADNHRWHGFEFRPGDIIVDAPSKSGTTWAQLLVALLVFDGPEFPEPVGKMSLWLEQKTRPVEEAHALFGAQAHRRFIKSHTPLDGLPMRDDIVYVCVGRDPRDAAVSMTHHSDNLDRRRLADLVGDEDLANVVQPPFEERLDRFIDGEDFPGWNLRYLAHHYRTFWGVSTMPNVGLFHYSDLSRDLPGQIRRLGAHLGLAVGHERATELADHATIDAARSRASDIAPEAHMGVFKSVEGFFRTGAVGEGRARMTGAQLERYDALARELMSPELYAWVHAGTRAP